MTMLHLYKNDDGNIHKATAGEPVTREYLQEQADKASAGLREWTEALAEYDRLAGTDKPKIKTSGTTTTTTILNGVPVNDHVISFKSEPPAI